MKLLECCPSGPKRGSGKPTVYTYPTKKAVHSVTGKVRTVTRQGLNLPLALLLDRLTPILGGWTTYFKHGVSKATFDYLRRFTWRRVLLWSAANTAARTGSGSDGTTCPGGGPRTETWHCSTPAR